MTPESLREIATKAQAELRKDEVHDHYKAVGHWVAMTLEHARAQAAKGLFESPIVYFRTYTNKSHLKDIKRRLRSMGFKVSSGRFRRLEDAAPWYSGFIKWKR